MSEIIAILSYANNQKKLDILEKCIDVSKSHGFKIVLSSAIDVPSYISDKVDFLIIDKENPVITGNELANIGGAIFYTMSYGWFTNSHCLDMNHSYAVLKLIKNAASVAQINGFNITHFINYDYLILDGKLFETHRNWLNESDLVYYYFSQNPNFMNTGFFSINTEKIVQCFKNINSKIDYCKKQIPILEEYMLSTFKEFGLKLKSEPKENIHHNNELDLITTSDYLISKKVGIETYHFFLFLSYDRDNQNYYIITLSDISTEVEISFNDKKTKLIINNAPRVFKIQENFIDYGIKFEIKEFNHSETINRDKKLSYCNIVDNSPVEEFESLFETDIIKSNFYEICLKHGTDKVQYHGYNYFYPNFIEKYRTEEFRFLEIGYGDGKSLPVWLEYFPKADITIADISFELIYSERCRVVKCDQSSKSDLENLKNNLGSVRLIIDDGSHNPTHQIETFEFLFQNLLEEGGTYIIEDIELSYWHPDSTLYGYKTSNINIIEEFRKYQEMINSEFSSIENYLNVSTITFAQNSIIITKRTKKEQEYFNRGYRFQVCVDSICSFG